MQSAEVIATIRRKPGMYIGGTDGQAVTHMIWEVVANAIDEYMAGRCDRIAVEFCADGSIMVEDNGRGIPVDDLDGVPFVERILTSIHTTPTRDGHSPHEHLTRWGIGLFPICALSIWLEVRIQRNGRIWRQRFERGVAVSRLKNEGPSDGTGTRISFVPDPEIFKIWPDPGSILARLHELAYLQPSLTLQFADRREHVLREPRGIRAYLDTLSLGLDSPLPTFAATAKFNQIEVEVAARWSHCAVARVESFANTLRTTEGGSHTRGLLLGLAAGLRKSRRKSATNILQFASSARFPEA